MLLLVTTVGAAAVVLELFRRLPLAGPGGDKSGPSGDKDAVESLDDRLGVLSWGAGLDESGLEEVRDLRAGREDGRGITLSSSSLTLVSCSSSSSIRDPGILCDSIPFLGFCLP